MVRVVAVVLLFGARCALAQPEIVPAEHPVYAFLADQRVAGVLPEFRAEALPWGRSTVRRMLDSLAVRDSRLGASGRFWLAEYRREFFEPLEGVHSFVGDGEAALLDPNAERTLFYHRSDDWRVAVIGEGTAQARASDADGTPGGLARVATLTFEGNWKQRLGIYTSTFAGAQVTGDTRVLQSDPVLRPLFYVSSIEVPQGPFDRTTASLRTEAGPFSAEIANERLRYGTSAAQPLVLGDGADYLPFVRLGLHSKVVDVQAVHAALNDQSVFTIDEEDGTNYLAGPDRYLALHRLEVQPVSWASAAFTEMAVYGFRNVEVAYLNPLFPVKAAEHALWDRDNTLFTLEATVRPIRGTEVYGTWLVDDLATARLGDADYGNKWGVQVGGQVAVPRGGVTVFGEYTRIEPYTYTHRFQREGSFYNSYVHNGFGLGHPLGPNSDQWLAGVQAWLPFRARLRAAARYVRHGANPVDPVTGEVTNVGGDVADGTFPGFGPDTKQFLAGDLYEGPGLQGLVEVEPFHGVTFRLFGDAQWWRDRPDDVFVRFELAVRP